jgi:hypothetical protein
MMVLTILISTNAYSSEVETYRKHLKMCYNHITNEWPTKRIYLKKEREGNKHIEMAVRCYKPACEQPFTFAVYEVRYIEGAKVFITCSFKDGDKPRLSRYNDQNAFTPPE